MPGARVRVRFAGRLRDGFVLERVATSDTDRTLAPLHKVVSSEPVLTASGAALVRARRRPLRGHLRRRGAPRRPAPARRHGEGGGEAPARRTPADEPPVAGAARPARSEAYRDGAAYVAALRRAGRSPRALWQVTPSAAPEADWAAGFAEAARACVEGGRTAVLLAPDQRDVARLEAACVAALGRSRVVALVAESGPGPRATAPSWPRCTGGRSVVVGNRAAAYAPVPRPGPGGAVGRRRRPVGRAARSVPAHPRGAGRPRLAERSGRLSSPPTRAPRSCRPTWSGAGSGPSPRTGSPCATRRRGSGSAAMTTAPWPATPPPGRPGCRTRSSSWSVPRCPPAPCWSRCRAPAGGSPSSARTAANRCAAASARARPRWPRGRAPARATTSSLPVVRAAAGRLGVPDLRRAARPLTRGRRVTDGGRAGPRVPRRRRAAVERRGASGPRARHRRHRRHHAGGRAAGRGGLRGRGPAGHPAAAPASGPPGVGGGAAAVVRGGRPRPGRGRRRVGPGRGGQQRARAAGPGPGRPGRVRRPRARRPRRRALPAGRPGW